MKKRRVLIYCYYDKESRIYKDTIRLLKEFRDVADYIVVVVNGTIENNSEIRESCDWILYRDNSSYDVGAYKEALYTPRIRTKVMESDELILCNNSFWGPFIPLKELFEKMESKECDLWGVTSSNRDFILHIQSYFLVYKKKILTSEYFWDYWDNYIFDGMSFSEVLACFENDMFHFLLDHGNKYATYVECEQTDLYNKPYESLMRFNIPILKKKLLHEEFWNEKSFLACLSYINDKYNWDIKYILEYCDPIVQKIYDKEYCRYKESVDYSRLIEFLSINDKVYIYGAGQVAESLYICNIYPRHISKIEAVIVSDGQEKKDYFHGIPIKYLSEIKEDNPAIVVALNSENRIVVEQCLKTYSHNILYLCS